MALMIASRMGHLNVVHCLVERSANKDAKDSNGKTVLMIATEEGHLKVMQYLIEQGAKKDETNNDSDTALMQTIKNGRLDSTELLIDLGADSSSLDSNENTALVLLLLRDETKEDDICPLARRLLENGTPPLKSNKDGKSAKSIARVKGFYHIEALVDECKSKAMPLRILEDKHGAENSLWCISPTAVSRDATPFASGGFGKVYNAMWSNSHVVLKEVGIRSRTDMKRFRREVKFWGHNKHRNLVQFYGANDRHEPYFLVSEFASNGELMNYLKTQNQGTLWCKMLEMAAGLNHLHENEIVHGDLKGNNIVVGSNGTAMLTDFGLSFHPSVQSSIQERRATLVAMQWRAPEYATMTVTTPSFESDVYSLGMCIIEAVTGGIPWGNGLSFEEIRKKLCTMERVIGKRSAMTDDEWLLVEMMISPRRHDRPKMQVVLSSLKKFATRYKDENLRKEFP